MKLTTSPELATTVFIIVLTIGITIVVNILLRSLIKVPKSFDTRRSRTYVTILRNIITVGVYAIALNIVLAEMGINITPLLASAGIVGIALGFGAKSLIEDLIAGVFLLSEDSIAIGDYVKIDTVEGTIEKIGFRTLVIRTQEGALAIIPNGMVKQLVNYSRHKARIIVEIPVPSDADIDEVFKRIQETIDTLTDQKDGSTKLLAGTIEGIDAFKPGGPLSISVTLTAHTDHRQEVARAFRLALKKHFEKNKLQLG